MAVAPIRRNSVKRLGAAGCRLMPLKSRELGLGMRRRHAQRRPRYTYLVRNIVILLTLLLLPAAAGAGAGAGAENVTSEAHGLASPLFPCVQNGTQQLLIATGSAGWEYNKTGKEICSKLNESGCFQCRAIVTRGSLQNVELLQDGKVNLALSQSDMIPDDSVDFVSLKTLSRQALYIFVRKDSDIDGIHDLMHQRINTGPSRLWFARHNE